MVQATALWLAILSAAAPLGPAPTASMAQQPPRAAAEAGTLAGLWRARQATCRAAAAEPCVQATERVVAQLVRTQWPSARAYSEIVLTEALAAQEPGRALVLARAAVALAPTLSAAHWAHAQVLARNHLYGAAARAGCAAAVQAICTPDHWALPAYSAAWAALFMLAVLALCAMALSGPQLAHDVAHLLPLVCRPYLMPLLAGGALLLCACLPFGPGLSALAVAAALLAHMSATWRAYLAHGSFLAAVALMLLVHSLQFTAAHNSKQGLRRRALTDATAPWATLSLAPKAQATGDDLWAHALLARRRGDAQEAEMLAERAIGAGETHEALLVLEANVLWERGDHARARAFLEQALAQAPEHALARYNLSVVLLSMAEPAAAESARARAFAAGGAALTEQVARAQAAGQLLLDAELPKQFDAAAPSDAQGPLLALAWHGVAPSLLGILSLPAALWALLAWALCHGLATWLARHEAWHDRLAQLVPVTSRCSRCQALSCPRCAPDAWDVGLCGPCQQAAFGADSAALALRDQQEVRSLAQYRVAQALRRVTGWVVPGAALIWQDFAFVGLTLCVLTATLGSIAVYAWRLAPPPFALWALCDGPGSRALAVACTLGAVGAWLLGLFAGRRND